MSLTVRKRKGLEAVFAREIDGHGILQSKAKVYDDLEAEGMVVRETVRFGTVTCIGWALTHRGRIAYCDWCSNNAPPRP